MKSGMDRRLLVDKGVSRIKIPHLGGSAIYNADPRECFRSENVLPPHFQRDFSALRGFAEIVGVVNVAGLQSQFLVKIR